MNSFGWWWRLGAIGFFLAAGGAHARAATFTVTSSAASGEGTLAWAVQQSNMIGGTNTIDLAIPGNAAIRLEQSLEVTRPILINGHKAQLVGIAASNSPASVFQFFAGSDGSEIRNLIIANGYIGLDIHASNIKVLGCAIGTDYNGAPGLGNGLGIWISGSNNQIGGPAADDRNIIAGNASYGILASAAQGLKIQGNYIGVGPDGATPLSNFIGLMLRDGTRGAQVGGNRNLGEGNVISGNLPVNVYILGSDSTGNRLTGNIIGARADLSAALENHCGVGIRQASGTILGQPGAGMENIVVGHSTFATFLGDEPRPRDTKIQNNYYGVTPANVSMPNSTSIFVGADGNLIGGVRGGGTQEGNVISATQGDAVLLMGDGNTVSGNYIGTSVDGSSGLGNITGVQIMGNGNLIGGENQGEARRGNVISGQSAAYGIYVRSGSDNRIQGNWVGTNAAGDAALANDVGIQLDPGSRRTVIGGPAAGLRNVVAGNRQSGIFADHSREHVIAGNYVGLSGAGNAVLRNGNSAIVLSESADCLVGGATPAERNLVCGVNDGIAILGAAATGNRVIGNWVGVLADLSPAAEAFVNGISVGNSASANAIGVPEEGLGNLIVGGRQGIAVFDPGSTGNGLFGNTIVGFSSEGIVIANAANAGQAEPEIGSADVSGVNGTSGPGDYIEIFQASRETGFRGGSLWFVGATRADSSGRWSLVPADFGLRGGGFACALATDSGNNTSRFSLNALVTGTNPDPTPAVTPGVQTFQVLGDAVRVYPNPAQDQVRFRFNQTQPGEVVVRIYNAGGERVAELRENRPACENAEVVWNAGGVAPGIYLARFLRGAQETKTLKFAIARD